MQNDSGKKIKIHEAIANATTFVLQRLTQLIDIVLSVM